MVKKRKDLFEPPSQNVITSLNYVGHFTIREQDEDGPARNLDIQVVKCFRLLYIGKTERRQKDFL